MRYDSNEGEWLLLHSLLNYHGVQLKVICCTPFFLLPHFIYLFFIDYLKGLSCRRWSAERCVLLRRKRCVAAHKGFCVAQGAGNSFTPRIKVKGKVELSDGWSDVPADGNSAFRFFTVEVELQ